MIANSFKFIKSILLLLCYVLFVSCSSTPNQQNYFNYQEPQIRVLLVHASNKKGGASLSVGGSYNVLDATRRIIAQGKSIEGAKVACSNQGIQVGNHLFKTSTILVQAQNDHKIKINKIEYLGIIEFSGTKPGKLSTLNLVPMETYLSGVIGSEMPLSWPDSALQAQAITARTYALYEYGESRKRKRPFDVYDTVASQVYKGEKSASPRSRKIIDDTRGLTMLYNNMVFKAFFHSTCGGHTASSSPVFDYHNFACLYGRSCPYCQGTKYYSWECKLDLSDLQQFLIDMKLPGPFLSIGPYNQDQAGRLQNLKVLHGTNQTTIVKASRFRTLITAKGKNIRSTKFTMSPIPNGILIRGNGWGHGVGMCQVGASKMSQKGFSCQDIIQFYYPGVILYRMWK